jgi:hypothetical protein
MTDFSASDGEGRWDDGGRRGAGRAHRARFPIRGLARLTILFLGLAMLSRPGLADAAAAGKGGGRTTLSAMHGPGLDRREVAQQSASGPVVVLRGTLPTRPSDGPPPPGESGGDNYAAPGDETFQPGPLYGSGWDTQFDYSGLSGTYFPVPQ